MYYYYLILFTYTLEVVAAAASFVPLSSDVYMHAYVRSSRSYAHHNAKHDHNNDDVYSCFRQMSDLLKQNQMHASASDGSSNHDVLLKQIATLGKNYGSSMTRLEGKWKRRDSTSTSTSKIDGFSRTSIMSLSAYLQKIYSITEEAALERIDATAIQAWSRLHHTSTGINTDNNDLFHVKMRDSDEIHIKGKWTRMPAPSDASSTFNNDGVPVPVPVFRTESPLLTSDTNILESVEYMVSKLPANNEDVIVVKRTCSLPMSSDNSIPVFVENLSENITCVEVFERDHGSNLASSTSSASRVPGCVTTVYVQTKIVYNKTIEGGSIHVDGMADAVLSRGLLALVSASLGNTETVDRVFGVHVNNISKYTPSSREILEIDPNKVADELGLRHILSVGRNDGLANMIRIIQDQISNAFRDNSAFDSRLDINKKIVETEDVAMLLSGGVDSSVALNLLLQQGYSVRAFYLKIWLEDELAHLGQCPWEDDWTMCQKVCEQAGVPLEAVSLQEQYKQQVISYTVEEAAKGRTPNPDIMCNARVKFGCFFDAIEGRNFKYISTGHYARLASEDDGNKRLLRAPDDIKDQSYFLSALNQDQLKRVLFPIGEYLKSDVRDLAQKFDLPNKSRPDSQGLCKSCRYKYFDKRLIIQFPLY